MIRLKYEFTNVKLKFIFICYIIFIILIYIYSTLIKKQNDNKSKFNTLYYSKDYIRNKFIIIQNTCNTCGLFSFYKLSIGCIHKYLIEGYIPIIDLKSNPNIINGFDIKKDNPWEIFFEQPFGYNLNEVLNNAKKIKKIKNAWEYCHIYPDQRELPLEESKRYFWHNIAKKFSPIKREIIDLSDRIMNVLFKKSRNILGVLARGTDYVAMKPKGHPIQPKIYDIIKDVKYMDDKYNYDYIFFSSEDINYRNIFEENFPKKIRQIKTKTNINYDYKQKQYLGFNKNVKGNIEFNKIYLLSIIILSKCLDLIATRCNGTLGALILTTGFRNTKIYQLGLYH